MRLHPVGLLTGLVACSGEVVQGPEPPVEALSYAEQSAVMFEPDQVLDIDITLDAADWDALRQQTRSVLDIVGSTCLEPPQSPFTYFLASVTIDGKTLANVGVRKKGFFGSLDTEKPSLKIKFNEYVPGQLHAGMKGLTLNNNKSDPSHIRQCLGYQLFAAAGVPAPRCNFARVSVNGADLGVYTHVEAIKKRFLSRFFANNDGNLYEGALSDFRTGWVDSFQRKTNKFVLDRSDIEALVPEMELPDAEVMAALAPHMDIDSFTTFWATELLVSHADGYARNTNNFYIYRDPDSGQFTFIPWGIDVILQSMDFPLPWETQTPPSIIWATSVLVQRLYALPQTQTAYLTRLQELLDAVWIEDEITAEIDRMQALLLPHVGATQRTDFTAAVQGVRDFVLGRRATIEAALAQTPPVWPEPLRDPWCVDVVGSVDGTFLTTWGTAGTNDPFSTGSGTLDVIVGTSSLGAPQAVGAASGIDPDSGEHVIQIVAWMPDDTALVAHLVVNETLLAPGASIPIDWVGAFGYLVRIEFPANQPAIVTAIGMIGDGMLTLDQASTTPGEPVSGSLTSPIYEPLF